MEGGEEREGKMKDILERRQLNSPYTVINHIGAFAKLDS